MLRVNRLLSAVGLCTALLLGSVPNTHAGLFDAWAKSCKITFSGYAGGATLTNFPVLVVLNTGISGFSYVGFQTNAADLRFEDALGASLPYEIDTWNSSGTSYVWVKVPLLSSSSDFITAYWQNNSATAPTNSTDTWDSSLTGVYHLGENLSNGGLTGTNRDSTAMGNHGLQHYTAPVASAKIGAGQMPYTSGQDNYVRFPGSVITPAAYTKELWYRWDGTNAGALLNGAGPGTNTTLGIQIGGIHAFSVGNNDPGSVSDVNPAPVAWVHLAATYDASVGGGTMSLYTNGILVGSAVDPQGTTPTNLYLFSTGAGWGCGGQADEVRISTVARSAQWILASYMTEGANSSFQTYAMNTNGTTSLISAGGTWSYQNDGTLPGASWYASGFSDGGWAAGPAPLGYADPAIMTTLSYGPDSTNKWITYYFRKHFTITSLASVTGLVANYEADDGAVFYLNGTKIHTTANILEPVGNSSLCNGTATEPYTWIPFTISPSMLVTGDNVLAVEVHQADAVSSDLYMDMSLDTVPYATTNELGGGFSYPVNWTAYNDTAWQADDGADVSTSYTKYSPSVTPSGALISESGSALPVTVTISTNAGSGDINYFALSTNVAPWPAGTDAANEFEGKVGRGYTCEIQGPGAIVDVAFAGLNPAKRYKLVVWASRLADGSNYSNRLTDVTLSGMDSFVNSSTVADGVTEFTTTVTDDSTTLRATFKEGYGPVARFEQIDPGADGMISFRNKRNVSSAGNAYLNAFKLVESDPVGGGDADVDGMDDAWETTYFGSTSAVNGGTNEDFDHDGSSNYDEYRAGTDPTSSSSKLEFTAAMTNAPGTVIFSWAGVNGKTYTVQGASTVTSSWTVLQSGIVGVSPTTVYTGAVSAARNFMRVKVE